MTEQDKVTIDDIIGIVKTDEPTDSVALKKEAQLSICEKRLIELEKENEQLKTVINRYEKYSNKKNDELNFRQLDILKLKEENEQLKCSNKDAWDLIQFIYNEIKEDGSMDFGRIKDLVELE